MLQIITEKISIEEKYLDSCIENHIFNKLKRVKEGQCTYKDGYIISVNSIISINSNVIANANSIAIFNVTYERNVLKPEEGQILSGKVCMIFHQGIFIDIYEKMKVLVPATTMNGYEYNADENNFVCEDKVIKLGLDISITIVMTKYEKKQFSCIGKLHNKF